MTDLTAMWEALAQYQPYADADGHGESWRKMCEERTEKAARAAVDAARAKAAWEAATAAWEATESTLQLHNSIKRIEAAIDALKAQRQPLTGKAIIAAYDNMELSGKLSAFIEGARYAEQAHGIGGDK